MEIGPVSSVRLVSTARLREADLGQPSIFEVQDTARMGDETYSPSTARAASGAEEEEYELLDDELDREPRPQAQANDQRRRVNYLV